MKGVNAQLKEAYMAQAEMSTTFVVFSHLFLQYPD